jgi:hypothetical protein
MAGGQTSAIALPVGEHEQPASVVCWTSGAPATRIVGNVLPDVPGDGNTEVRRRL